MRAVCSGAWADYYTPTADEVITFTEVYNASGSGYSNHSAVAWGAASSATNSKKAGDPANSGAATSEAVTCYSVKGGNTTNKQITVSISGCSKLTVYHESRSDRYVKADITPNSGDATSQSSSASTYFTEIELDGTKSYTIVFHGYKISDNSNQDFYLYAVKLTKYVSRTIATQTFTGVKLDGTALTADAAENGYSVDGTTITLSDDLVAYATPTTVTLTNHVVYTDSYEENKNVDVTFDGTITAGYYVGTATIGETTYTVKMKQDSQSITAISLSGVAMSSSDLATLNSTHAVSVDGSSINGVGNLALTLTGGTTTITRTFDGDDVNFTFTLNASENYIVTYTDVAKTYTLEGLPVYYSKDGTEVDGKNTNTVTANGISFAMVNTDKPFQYGAGSATISGNVYVPLKLSTGSGVNVTFPSGKVATKVIVYGWSLDGNGAINSISETSTSDATDTSSDIFYATNNATDVYPSVYEYDLDNWESFYFNPGGSASQPFVVMDFVLTDAPITPAKEYTTFSSTLALDFTGVVGLEAYVVSAQSATTATLSRVYKVPAETGLILKKTGSAASYNVPELTASADVFTNKLVAVTEDKALAADEAYVLSEGKFVPATAGTLPAGKAYLPVPPSGARSLTIVFEGEATGISTMKSVESTNNEIYNLNGQRVVKAQKGLYIQNGKKMIKK